VGLTSLFDVTDLNPASLVPCEETFIKEVGHNRYIVNRSMK
jgi:hypothetical protein